MNAGKLFGFANDRRMMSKGKVRAPACDNKIFKHIFYLFCFWVCFCGLSPFFPYNSFLFIFFLLIFLFVLCYGQ